MQSLSNGEGALPKIHLPRWNELPAMDLYMDQVLSTVDPCFEEYRDDSHVLTGTMVNNYVKLGLIPAPVRRRYPRGTVARLIVIVTLKPLFQVKEIAQLIEITLDAYSIDKAYDAYCDMFEKAVASVRSSAAPERKDDGIYLNVIEEVCLAAAYQLDARYRLRARSAEKKDETR
jgi:hypothetical protein